MESYPKHIKVETKSGVYDIPNVDEYASGRKYFFVRLLNENKTISIRRSIIKQVQRKGRNSWKTVSLPKKIIE